MTISAPNPISRRLLGVLAFFLCLAFAARAADDPGPEKSLPGIWLYKNAEMMGGFEGYTIRKTDGTEMQIGHFIKPDVWFFADKTWKVSGKTVTEVVIRCNLPGVPTGKPTHAETLRLDNKTYVYHEEGGETRTETKVDVLPDTFQKKLNEMSSTTPVPATIPST